MPFRYSTLFYLSLAYLASLRLDASNPDKADLLAKVKQSADTIRCCTTVSNINYRHWLSLLEAELHDLGGDHTAAMRSYEAALDHAEDHGFIMDEALIYELYAQSMVRVGAERPACRLIRDCIASYKRVSGFGKSEQVTQKYRGLLEQAAQIDRVDAECQTSIDGGGGNGAFPLMQSNFQDRRDLDGETSADRTKAWVLPTNKANGQVKNHETQADLPDTLSAVGLDMIDLTSILESSQVMSSELKEDKLLAKMTEIILESTGAELGAMVVRDDDIGWRIAAVCGPEGVRAYPDGQTLDTVEDHVAKQVTLYVLRFKETVFVQNLYLDDRFSNVSESYLKRNPDGKSVIALPIVHGDAVLLGSLYVEGPPNSFTDRNVTVLRLLVSQIAISLGNALLFKRLERVSASNVAMLEMQKRSLAQAREAETKAKEAEAVAIRNMKLKEEAAKAKSMFLANVSHELRTPLNVSMRQLDEMI